MERQTLARAVAAALKVPESGLRIERGRGGGNSRIHVVTAGDRKYVAKEYFRDPSDPRDRLQAEWAFLEYAQRAGIGCVPRPVARDAAVGIGVYEQVEGRNLGPADITPGRVQEAAAFFTEINRHQGEAESLGVASEACFSVAEHLAMVDGRVARLGGIAPEDRAAREFVAALEQRWREVRGSVLEKAGEPSAPVEERCVSPSDFGFHNALVRPDGTLCFLDFEYAGWDDPAKTAGDFFAHPGIPVPREHFDTFVAAAMRFSPHAAALEARARLLEPLFRLKWCCIVLNEFVPDAARRLSFAAPEGDREQRKQRQLAKARALLASI